MHAPMWLTLAAIAVLVAPTPSMGSAMEEPIVPTWIYPGASLRIQLTRTDSNETTPCGRSTRLLGRFLASDSDSLWIESGHSHPISEWIPPYRSVETASDTLSIFLPSIKSIREFRSNWGWAPTSRTSRGPFRSGEDLRLELTDGTVLEVRPLRVSADSLIATTGSWRIAVTEAEAEAKARPGLDAMRSLSRDDLCRVDLRGGSHNLTGVGAIVGLVGGVALGYLATAIAGEAETDGTLPAWGLIVGPFVGALVGRLITVVEWNPVWTAR